jgi:hypothetical protein
LITETVGHAIRQRVSTAFQQHVQNNVVEPVGKTNVERFLGMICRLRPTISESAVQRHFAYDIDSLILTSPLRSIQDIRAFHTAWKSHQVLVSVAQEQPNLFEVAKDGEEFIRVARRHRDRVQNRLLHVYEALFMDMCVEWQKSQIHRKLLMLKRRLPESLNDVLISYLHG